MQIVPYPHPALRWKAGDITKIDDNLRALVREMFRLMYEAKGIGLAANQVGVPLRLFVVNPSGDAEDKDNELVFINPTIRKRKGQISGEEGCLSLPGLYADVVRAEEIVVEAFDLNGQPFRIKLDELPARVIQHENDHLDGVMFIDRLDDTARAEVSAKVAEFMSAYTANRKEAGRQTDDEICEELKGISTKGYLPAVKAPV